MGCDIHLYAERRTEHGWRPVPNDIVDWAEFGIGDRNYSMFAFLAGLRDYWGIPGLSAPRGVPNDASPETQDAYQEWLGDAHSASWFTLDELDAADYGATFTWTPNSLRRPDPGQAQQPETMTIGEAIGEGYFTDLAALRKAGAERIVFWFDN